VYECKGCGKNVGIDDSQEMKISCGSICIFFRLCWECLGKYNNRQLNLEHLRFSFPVQARSAIRNMLANSF
jgi:hypothetical protein